MVVLSHEWEEDEWHTIHKDRQKVDTWRVSSCLGVRGVWQARGLIQKSVVFIGNIQTTSLSPLESGISSSFFSFHTTCPGLGFLFLFFFLNNWPKVFFIHFLILITKLITKIFIE